ncbi:hypothetical protein Sm713_67700 [Streptomyces sp. TS71-3]|nr:hypothetical protein Sm713_67700 [Streptomyces sp. TS71-3]
MTGLDLAGVEGAPTFVDSAADVRADDNKLGHWEACRVTGTIAPQVRFELLLPTRTWHQRYLQTGCGGYCGTVSVDAPASEGCVPLTNGTFAVASSNEGHQGAGGFNAAFGTDPTLRADFGYASDHKLALAAHHIIRAFYGTPARYSYFDGCSQGGHQGLTEAQRYPDDFDGIVSGAPASVLTALNVWYQGWNAKANVGSDGRPLLTAEDLAPLHKAVVAACDNDDGTQDGLLADPRACDFEPSQLMCQDGHRSSTRAFCLTRGQATAVSKLYEGPRDGNGALLYPGWQLPGSELNWKSWIVPVHPGEQTLASQIATSTWRFMVHSEPRPGEDLSDLSFTRAEFARIMGENAGIYDATDPDLGRFSASGGKLILWHGYADPAISPVGTIAYYRAVQDAMGGSAKTSAFARLFMLPGMAHCTGGQGPDQFDALGAAIGWVEHGKAPTRLVTRSTHEGKTTATRPVYPYPLIAVNTTGGPNNRASSYTARQPATEHDDRIAWLGTFRSGYQQQCAWDHGRWVCSAAARRG